MKTPSVIYLDNNATTPLDVRVFEAMRPYFIDKFGNPASTAHAYGWEAKAALDLARESVAASLGSVRAESVIFTSGATEANNLALTGIMETSQTRTGHIISQVTEHACVLKTLKFLQTRGHQVTLLPVDSFGRIDPDDLKRAFRKNTRMVSIMTANNEIGTVHDIKTLVAITRDNSQALFHTDAAQAAGKMPVNVTDLDVDLMSFSAHKMHGPKGAGVLYVAARSPRIQIHPLMHGGSHENSLRAGTVNLPAVVGAAKAFEWALSGLQNENARQRGLLHAFWQKLQSELSDISLNGDPRERLANNLNIHLHGTPAEEIIKQAKTLAMATGSACASGNAEPSYVLQAIGLSREEAQCSLRISIGRMTTDAEIKKAASDLIEAVKAVREQSLSYQAYRAGQSSA